MAAKFLVNVDFTGLQLLNARLEQIAFASEPTASGANSGRIWYDTTNNRFRGSNGTSVDTLTNVLESIAINATANGLTVGAVTGKSQTLTLALASGSSAGALSTTFYNLLNGATATNTNSTLVLRDGSGNFAASTITASLTGTASNATNLNNQAGSFYLARANHTGTQLAATISDFDSQVRTSRLDQMAAPTAAVSYNSQRITNLADPSGPQDAATKSYVDGVASGLDVKPSVRAASTANVTATYNATGGTSGRGQFTAAPNTLDGVTLAANNRILLKNQSTAAQNGIYVVSTLGTGANGVWDRATDFDADAEVTAGAFTFVEEGTANQDTGYVLTTDNPITIGGASGTSLSFTQFSGAGSYQAGNGLQLSGSTFSVKVDSTSVNANSLSVSGTGVTIATTYVGQSSITTVGTITTGVWTGTAIAVANGGTGATSASAARTNLGAVGRFAQTLSTSASTYTVTHNLNSVDVDVVLKEISTNQLVYADVVVTDANNVSVTFATTVAANAYRAVVIG